MHRRPSRRTPSGPAAERPSPSRSPGLMSRATNSVRMASASGTSRNGSKVMMIRGSRWNDRASRCRRSRSPKSQTVPAGAKAAGSRREGSEMEGTPPRLPQASNWYLQSVDALPAGSWNGPTLCEGWTAANVVAHVVTGDQLIRGLVWKATGKDWGGQDLPVDFADRQRRFEIASKWEPSKLKEMAHSESAQTVAAIHDAVQKAPEALGTML